jgi:hypothetical protein
VKAGKTSSRKAARARILLKADAGPEGPEWNDTKIADAFEVSRQTVEGLRKRADVCAPLPPRPATAL